MRGYAGIYVCMYVFMYVWDRRPPLSWYSWAGSGRSPSERRTWFAFEDTLISRGGVGRRWRWRISLQFFLWTWFSPLPLFSSSPSRPHSSNYLSVCSLLVLSRCLFSRPVDMAELSESRRQPTYYIHACINIIKKMYYLPHTCIHKYNTKQWVHILLTCIY